MKYHEQRMARLHALVEQLDAMHRQVLNVLAEIQREAEPAVESKPTDEPQAGTRARKRGAGRRVNGRTAKPRRSRRARRG